MNKPLMRPSDIRKAVAEWCAQGLSVTLKPDGEMKIEPPQEQPDTLSDGLIDWRNK